MTMTIQKFATQSCKNLLPKVLVDYLWQLAAESDAATQTFILSPKYEDVGEVQDILHRRSGFSSWRRVFGFQPVEAVVEVRLTGQSAIMALQGEHFAPAEAGRKEELLCSA